MNWFCIENQFNVFNEVYHKDALSALGRSGNDETTAEFKLGVVHSSSSTVTVEQQFDLNRIRKFNLGRLLPIYSNFYLYTHKIW